MIRTGYLRWEIEVNDVRSSTDPTAREVIFLARPSYRIVRVKKAGTAVALTSTGTGSAHKLHPTAAGATDVTFDPNQKRVELSLAQNQAWLTGEPVVYNNGGGSNITGLTSGGFISVQNLMSAAKTVLSQVGPGAPSGDPNQAYEVALAQVFQSVNGNSDFVQQELAWGLIGLYPMLT